MNGRAQMAANLYILCPGSPFIYYGEEIGMAGSRGSANTDANRRLAMLWGDGDGIQDPFGTTYDPAKQIPDTVADQKANEYSLYSYYKKLLSIRAAYPAIARGEYTPVIVPDSKLGGFIADWDGQRVCVLHNTTLSSAKLDLAELGLGDFTQLGDFIGVEEASLADGVLRLGSQTSAVLIP
jgi:glycosidase